MDGKNIQKKIILTFFGLVKWGNQINDSIFFIQRSLKDHLAFCSHAYIYVTKKHKYIFGSFRTLNYIWGKCAMHLIKLTAFMIKMCQVRSGKYT